MKTLKSVMLGELRQKVETESGESVSRQSAIALAIIDKAMKGDLHAAAFIRDLTDKATEEKALPQSVTVRVIE